MSGTASFLTETTEHVFAQTFDDRVMRLSRMGQWPNTAWDLMVEHGLPRALVEGEQGYDIPLAEGLALVRLIGRYALPLPLAETMIGNLLLARAGLPTTDRPIALIPQGGDITLTANGSSHTATGYAERVAWGNRANALVIDNGDQIALMAAGFDTIKAGTNLALMPRDTIRFEGEVTVAPASSPPFMEAGALIRSLMMAGALETLIKLTAIHVSERMQFGRTLASFQAVQHQLAQLASEAAAGVAAADLAAVAFAGGSARTGTAIAAARARLGDAATTAIGIAHQLHGAIGFTEEHRLHWFTTALWSWNDEFGSAAWWTRRLGADALGTDKSGYWPFVTSI